MNVYIILHYTTVKMARGCCPKGTRKICEKIPSPSSSFKKRMRTVVDKFVEEHPESHKKFVEENFPAKKTTRKRCPKGTRKDKNGNCVPKTEGKQPKMNKSKIDSVVAKFAKEHAESHKKFVEENFPDKTKSPSEPDKVFRIKVMKNNKHVSVLDLDRDEVDDINVRISDMFDIPEMNVETFYDLESDYGFIVDPHSQNAVSRDQLIEKVNKMKFTLGSIGEERKSYTIVLTLE